MLRAVAKGERLLGARASAARLRTGRTRRHASLKLGGWNVDFANVNSETATMTVHKGKEFLKLTLGVLPKVGQCPDRRGEVKGTAPFVFKIDGEFTTDKAPEGWPEVAAKPASAFVHVTSALHVTSISRDDDTAHLVDYDVRGKDLEHLQMGLKDAHGRVLATNAPSVVSLTLSADHVKPPTSGEAWTRALLGRSTYAAHLTPPSDPSESLKGPLVKWVAAVEALGTEYQRAEAEHWQKDCLQINGSRTPAMLRSNGHGQVTITSVTARGGTLKTPVPLTMTANAAVAPAAVTWVGTPIALDYTAPSGRAWDGEGVAVRAVSRMGVGTASFAFEHERSPEVVRITSRITRDLSPYGSATYDLTSVVPLQFGPGDGPPHAFGSAPLTWNAFAYHDDGKTEYCQNGETGVSDYDGVGADPGRIDVLEAFPWDPYTVRFTITPPVEHYVSTTIYPTCGTVTYAVDHTLWNDGLSVLKSQPGVTVSGNTWTVGGFRDGAGAVEKYRDIDVGTVHLRIELVQTY
jgi:hypothetical protein